VPFECVTERQDVCLFSQYTQVLGPDVSDIDYVAFTSDQDAYAYR
jgi:aromatic ring-cleaving dioxygenase